MTHVATSRQRSVRALPATAAVMSILSVSAASTLTPSTSATSERAAVQPAAVQAGVPVAGPPTTPVALTRVAPSAAATRASFAKVQSRLDGPAGVVVFRVGATKDERPLIWVGSLTTEVAWSTSKVPVTVAALSKSSSKTTKSRAKAAITKSDNAAAEKLWSSLGSPKTAGARTQAVVRAGGDYRTKVETKRVRAGFTAFGQTRWRLDDQARFAAGLGCLPQARATVKLMSQVIPEQRFGLGRLKQSAIKGGWGPVEGGYLTRQMAIVTMPDGTQFGVAVGVRTAGGFNRGKSDLAKVAAWVGPQLAARQGGRCPRRA